jgi:hypothetical protein
MKTMGGSYHDLAALAAAEFSDARQTYKASPLGPAQSASTQSLDSSLGKSRCGGPVLPAQQQRLSGDVLPNQMLRVYSVF